jgi:integrase
MAKGKSVGKLVRGGRNNAAVGAEKLELSVAKALDQYFFEHVRKKAVCPITVEISMRHLKKYFRGFNMRDLGIPESRAYIEHRQKNGAALSTASRELGTLRAAALHAVRWRRISLEEAPTFEQPKIAASKGIWLFEDELERLRRGTNKPFQIGFIELCYYTASRRGAVERLTWDRVDLERNRIKLAYDDVETKKRRPTVAIDPKLKKVLQWLWEHKVNDRVLGDVVDFNRPFYEAAKKAGLLTLPARDNRPSAKITPHMLRHSRATHLLQAGKDPWVVAGLLGDSLQTVIRIYGHHWTGHQETLFEPPSIDVLLA